MPIEPIRLDAAVDDRVAPALLFVPASDAPLPLVLLGHGAHLSKDDDVMQLLARGIARGVPAAAAGSRATRASLNRSPGWERARC